MKTCKALSKTTLIALTMTLMPWHAPMAIAGDGGNGSSGGNGGGSEVAFEAMSIKIQNWLERNLANGTLAKKLQLHSSGVSAKRVVQAFRDSLNVKKTSIKFIAKDRLQVECQKGDLLACELMKSSRICMNSTFQHAAIDCNEDLFNAQPKPVQFAINFHEHLGIEKIETNDEFDYSRYPISKYIVDYVQDQTNVSWDLGDSIKTAAKPIDGPRHCASFSRGAMFNPDGYDRNIREVVHQSYTRCLIGHYVGANFEVDRVEDVDPQGNPLKGFRADPYGVNMPQTIGPYYPMFYKDAFTQLCIKFGYRRGFVRRSTSAVIHSTEFYTYLTSSTPKPRNLAWLVDSIDPADTFWDLPLDADAYPIVGLTCLR